MTKPVSTQSRFLKIAYHTSYDFHEDKSAFGEALKRYRALYPDVVVTEALYEFKDLRNALATGDADLIFSASFAFEDLKFVSSKK